MPTLNYVHFLFTRYGGIRASSFPAHFPSRFLRGGEQVVHRFQAILVADASILERETGFPIGTLVARSHIVQ
jgi:hypothetical protein